jgi:phospholipid/cholesterol/gamma-HCH transport system substrate-binding protein
MLVLLPPAIAEIQAAAPTNNCMGHPGKRAPTVEICNSDKPFEPLAMRQHFAGPYPLDPNLLSQGITPDDRTTGDQRIFGPVEGTPLPPPKFPTPPSPGPLNLQNGLSPPPPLRVASNLPFPPPASPEPRNEHAFPPPPGLPGGPAAPLPHIRANGSIRRPQRCTVCDPPENETPAQIAQGPFRTRNVR